MTHNVSSAPLQGAGSAWVFGIFAGSFFLIGAAISIVDAILMAKGAAQMAPGEIAWLMSIVALAVAAFKAAWLSVAREFLLRRLYFLVVATVFSGLLLHTFSIVCTTGLAAVGRDTAMAGQQGVKDKHRRAQDRYDTALARGISRKATRSEAEINAALLKAKDQLATAKADVTASGRDDRAQRIAARSDRQKAVDALEAEQQEAIAFERAQNELTLARQELDSVGAVPRSVDPQVAAFADLTGISASAIGKVLSLLPSTIVEVGGTLAWLIAGALASFAWAARREAQALRFSPQAVRAQRAAMVQKTDKEPAVVRNEPQGASLEPLQVTDGRVRSKPQIADLTDAVLSLRARGESERSIAGALSISKSSVHRIIASAPQDNVVSIMPDRQRTSSAI